MEQRADHGSTSSVDSQSERTTPTPLFVRFERGRGEEVATVECHPMEWIYETISPADRGNDIYQGFVRKLTNARLWSMIPRSVRSASRGAAVWVSPPPTD
ncbi:hypothetical protein GCM10010483_01110 [Actinokineospora diospyrosa]